mmetsp:Transcript_13146/g.43758  ORF Transcript_13146/g.43758 Transcript_13146/m.43758 type:complete len:327 (-) Transcript_13146:60-1040(-)
MRAPSRSSDAHSLFGMASAALAEAISDASRSPASLLGVGSLALVPSPLSARLFKAVAAELSQAAPQPVLPSPPLPLLRLWYGSRHVERLAVSAADDDWAVEVGGCSALPALSSLDLPGARLTAHGAAHLAAGLRALTHLRIADCHGLGAAGFGVLCGGCLQLVSLQLPNCKIALDAAAVRTMVDRLAGLTALDLGGNLLASAAVPPLCSAPLRLLRVWGSVSGDDAALSLMDSSCLSVLDLGWTGATALGLQCVSLGLGAAPRALRPSVHPLALPRVAPPPPQHSPPPPPQRPASPTSLSRTPPSSPATWPAAPRSRAAKASPRSR